MKKIFLIIISILVVACGKTEEKNELDKIIQEGNYIIVDVRTNKEYSESHLVGAINIPHSEIDYEINLDKSKTILVYCKSGQRSSEATKKLTELGYDVYDMGAYNKIDLPKK